MSEIGTMDLRSVPGLYGACRFTTVSGGTTIAVGTKATAFQDRRGESTNGNLTLTDADANFFGGEVPKDTRIFIFGIQMSLRRIADELADAEAEQFLQDMGVTIYRGQSVQPAGRVQHYPSGLGLQSAAAASAGRDGAQPFRFPRRNGKEQPLILEPLDTFYLEFKAARELAGLTQDATFQIDVYCPALVFTKIRQLQGA